MNVARPRPRALNRLLYVLALVLAGLFVWHKAGWLAVRLHMVRYRLVRFSAERLADSPSRNAAWVRPLLGDFARLDVYRDRNRALPPAPPDRVVLYGDSITDYWVSYAPETFFPGKGYIGRGIEGQTTPELLWRFQQDVIDLHPQTVVLLGGVNDIHLRTLRIAQDETERNLDTMATMARRHGIRMVLCSLLPSAFGSPAYQAPVLHKILTANAWLKSYAAGNGLLYVDYFSAMAGPNMELRRELRRDPLHPNAAGYRVMERVLEQALDNDPTRPAQKISSESPKIN